MKKKIILVALFSILTTVLIIYFFFGKESKKQFSWKETYKTGSDQPYGTMFIRQLLQSYRPGEKFIYNENTSLADLLRADSIGYPADYIFIGKQLWLSEEDTRELLEFIRRGNEALISTRYLPYQLIDSIFFSKCGNEMYVDEDTRSAATFNFYHESLKTENGYTYAYKTGSQTKKYDWAALEPGIFCDSAGRIVPLGHLDNNAVNFFKLPFGAGNLYIHTNPIAFTNYFMRMQDKAEYAAGVFSHLRGKTIIWDEYSRSQFTSSDSESNPLALVMQHDSLKYAWWIMLVSVILYTLFTAKRKQRIVPVREEKTNTSLEYVKMVSALHFKNRNDKDMAMKKMKHFLYFIRAKYGMHSARITQDFLKRLAVKSQIDLNHIESIFEQYSRIEKNPDGFSGAHELMSLYGAIDHFYKHCK